MDRKYKFSQKKNARKHERIVQEGALQALLGLERSKAILDLQVLREQRKRERESVCVCVCVEYTERMKMQKQRAI
jgi:hypothetical protein